MADKVYIVEGRQFRTAADYKLAEQDKTVIDKLRERTHTMTTEQLKSLRADILKKKIRFNTLLGDDFAEELGDLITKRERADRASTGRGGKNTGTGRDAEALRRGRGEGEAAGRGGRAERKAPADPSVEAGARQILQARERRRKLILWISTAVAVLCVGYVGLYYYLDYRNSQTFAMLSGIKQNAEEDALGPHPGKGGAAQEEEQYATVTLDEVDTSLPDVLPEYEDLLKKNRNLIGWIKIDDIVSDEGLPVMQLGTDNPGANTWYLTHSFDGKENRNGTLFMDANCDAATPGTNLIIYGHHMKSGAMFGKLDKYEDEKFWQKHPTISFDTIYEKGTYDIMYVFRSHLDTVDSVAFKYYQFYEAYSEVEFDSYMREMADLALYDTGVTAVYGDHLLTLSTCDYEEENGRFVVVAKKRN